MPSVVLSPIGGAGQQFFDNNGNVLAGGMLYTYAAGTTNPLVTYSDNAGTTPNSNPVLLDSAGRPEEEIWLAYSTAYKIVLKDSDGLTIYTWDNVTNDYTFPAILPITSGQNLTNLNASQLTSGTFSWDRAPFVPEEAAKKGQPNGYAGLDGSGALQQTPGVGSVQTSALVANAVTNYGTVEVLNTTFTSSSTSYVDVTGMSFSMTVTGGVLRAVIELGEANYGTAGGNVTLAVQINGTDYQLYTRNIGNTGVPVVVSKYIPGIPAGTYTMKLRYKSTNGNNCQLGSTTGQMRLTVEEFKK